VTDANGIADSGTFTANGAAGTYRATATLADGSTASFELTNAILTTMTGVSGSAIRGGYDVLSATLSGGGAGLSGQPVVFAVNGLVVVTATTNSAGTATLTVPIGNTAPGTYIGDVTAAFIASGNDSGSSANGTLTVLSHGIAAHIAASGGASQTAYFGTIAADSFQAIVTDIYGNPVPSQSVVFTAALGSGKFAGGGLTATVATDSNGVATAPDFTAGTANGNFTITAKSSPGMVFGSTNFSLKVAPYPISLSGIQVQKGSVERSFVRYLTIDFANNGGLSTIAPGLEQIISSVGTTSPRIKLTFRGLDGLLNISQTLTQSEFTISGNTILIDFGTAGITGFPTSTSGDGYYQISVDATGNGTFATKTFDRLLGDVNGDGQVDINDLNLVTASLGMVGTDLQADVDGSGAVNQLDRLLVARSQGRKLSGSLILNG
jgi:hypothetical protein